jgi:hypothetical protein
MPRHHRVGKRASCFFTKEGTERLDENQSPKLFQAAEWLLMSSAATFRADPAAMQFSEAV